MRPAVRVTRAYEPDVERQVRAVLALLAPRKANAAGANGGAAERKEADRGTSTADAILS